MIVMLDFSHRATVVTAATLGLPLGLRGLVIPHRNTAGQEEDSGPLRWLEMFPFAEECFAQALARIT